MTKYYKCSWPKKNKNKHVYLRTGFAIATNIQLIKKNQDCLNPTYKSLIYDQIIYDSIENKLISSNNFRNIRLDKYLVNLIKVEKMSENDVKKFIGEHFTDLL